MESMTRQMVNMRVFDIQHDRVRYDMYVMRWNGERCPGNPCRFIQNIQNAMNSAHWQLQEHLQKWNKDRNKINWSLFQDYLNYESKPPQRSTNPTESYMKSFKIKLFLDKLSTIETCTREIKRNISQIFVGDV
ncbi:12081_t:CDS:1 [Gigaspora rosea]|nr:12081_t:CDS:1 [Gigaspora rosea]